ncbi:MAG: DUF4397 domain-containing protein [Pseudomonadales bacterium]
MWSRTGWLLMAALTLGLAACDAAKNDDTRGAKPPDPTRDYGILGFVNAMPDAPPLLLVYRGTNGGGGTTQLSFGQAVQESTIVGGYLVQVSYVDANGDVVVVYENTSDDTLKLFADDETTVVLSGTLADPQAFLVENTEYLYGVELPSDPNLIDEPPEVQFINTVQGHGALDIYLTASAADLAAATPAATLDYQGISTLSVVTPGTDYRLRVTPSGDPATVLYDSGTFEIASTSRTLFAAFDYFGPGTDDVRVKILRGGIVVFPNEPIDHVVRATDVVADVAAVDVYLGDIAGAPDFAAVGFGTRSDYLAVPGGTYSVNVTPAGVPSEVLFNGSLAFAPGDASSLYFSGLQSDPANSDALNVKAVGFPEDNRPIPGFSQVQVVHGAATASTVNIYLLRPGETTDGQIPDFLQLQFGGSSNTAVGSGDYDVLVVNAADDTPLIGPDRVTLAEDTIYTLVLRDTAGGGAPLEYDLLTSPVGF